MISGPWSLLERSYHVPACSPRSLTREIPADRAGYGQFYEKFRPLVFSTVLRHVHNLEDARDLTQQVFLKVWQDSGKFRGGKVEAWLVSVARNAAIDSLRRCKFDRSRIINAAHIVGADDVEGEVMANVIGERVQKALGSLPPRQRDLLIASFWSQMSHEAISHWTRLPLGTVKTRIRSALHRLRREVHELRVA